MTVRPNNGKAFEMIPHCKGLMDEMGRDREGTAAGTPRFPWVAIVALLLIIAGAVLGLLFHRVGSAELFLSGLALLLLQDLLGKRTLPVFQRNSKVLSFTLVLFTLGSLILGLTGAFELVYLGAASPPSWALPLTIGIIGEVCLFLAAVPYFLWVLIAARTRK